LQPMALWRRLHTRSGPSIPKAGGQVGTGSGSGGSVGFSRLWWVFWAGHRQPRTCACGSHPLMWYGFACAALLGCGCGGTCAHKGPVAFGEVWCRHFEVVGKLHQSPSPMAPSCGRCARVPMVPAPAPRQTFVHCWGDGSGSDQSPVAPVTYAVPVQPAAPTQSSGMQTCAAPSGTRSRAPQFNPVGWRAWWEESCLGISNSQLIERLGCAHSSC
jgi:hypothetical protein